MSEHFEEGSQESQVWQALQTASLKIAHKIYLQEWETYKKKHGWKASRRKFESLPRSVPQPVQTLVQGMNDLGRGKITAEQAMALLHTYEIHKARFE